MRITPKTFGWALLFFMFSFSYAGEKTIVIDVSHGGKNNGTEIDGFTEKDLALEIALKVIALNKTGNMNIILTREGDYDVSLNDRVEFINSLNPDYVISLHVNSNSNTEVNGFDFFISPESAFSEKSKALAQGFENSVSKELSSNGIKNANFNILKNVTTPIVLIEMGYLSNLEDRKLLTSINGQDKIAEVIYNMIK